MKMINALSKGARTGSNTLRASEIESGAGGLTSTGIGFWSGAPLRRCPWTRDALDHRGRHLAVESVCEFADPSKGKPSHGGGLPQS
jgi:hypothetical protein